jgi:uncharacterized protein YqhQ
MKGEQRLYGGRALSTGVLMVGPGAMAVAIRRPDGTIATESERFVPPFAWARRVLFLRGLLSMASAVVLAVRSARLERRLLGTSGNAKRKQMLGMIGPVLAVTGIDRLLRPSAGRPIPRLQRLGRTVLGAFAPLFGFRIAGFLPPGRRLLQYHAAEHMAVNAVESGQPLTAEAAAKQSRIHPRCGTSFGVAVMLLTPIVNRGRKPGLVRTALSAALVISLAYEILRLGARHRNAPWARILFAPVWQAQLLTTSVPTSSHLEVACAALAAVIGAEADEVPAAPALV